MDLNDRYVFTVVRHTSVFCIYSRLPSRVTGVLTSMCVSVYRDLEYGNVCVSVYSHMNRGIYMCMCMCEPIDTACQRGQGQGYREVS